jgi:hypothetical protein
MHSIRDNKLLTRLHMQAALLKSDSLAIDVHYFIYSWARQREKDVTAPTLKMTVEKRIRFEAMFKVAQEEVVQTRMLVHSFWAALAEKAPDLARLQRNGVLITTALTRCRSIFDDLMALAPQVSVRSE